MAAFGTMNLSNNLDMLIYANHLCNEYGLDTIGAGGAICGDVDDGRAFSGDTDRPGLDAALGGIIRGS